MDGATSLPGSFDIPESSGGSLALIVSSLVDRMKAIEESSTRLSDFWETRMGDFERRLLKLEDESTSGRLLAIEEEVNDTKISIERATAERTRRAGKSRSNSSKSNT